MMKVSALVVLAIASTGCFMSNPAPNVPRGAQRVVSQQVDGPRWYCEDGDEIVLVNSSAPALHVSSIDARITNSWTAADGRHFFALFDGHDFGQTFIKTAEKSDKFGVEYVIPKDPNADAIVARYASIGGHGPKTAAPGERLPTLRKFDGGTSRDGATIPNGDPWSREVCWSPRGPFVQAAKQAGRSPSDFELVGARVYDGSPIPRGPHGHLVCSANVQNVTNWGTFTTTSDAFVRPPYYARVSLDLASSPRRAYLLTNDGRGIVVDEYRGTDPDSESHQRWSFYFERGATGFRLRYVPGKPKEEPGIVLEIYAPGDLQSDELPPDKKQLAAPIMEFPYDKDHHLVGAAWWCFVEREDK
jgi:hypothetical protein